VPPLRDHLEDIPELAAYFLDKVPSEDGGRAMHVAPDALRILTAHSWPGNVRELENLCRRAATMGTTDRMTADLIGPWLNPISTISTDLGALRDKLLGQLAQPVLWTSCVQEMTSNGVSQLVECGPGKVLAGLVKRIDRSVSVANIESPGAFDEALADLGRGSAGAKDSD